MVSLSEVAYSQLEERLDAEYYKPLYLEIIQKLSHFKNKDMMKSLFLIKDGDHAERAREFVKVGIRYLRAQDLKDGFIDDNKAVFVSKEVFNSLKRSHIHPLDILFSIMGATDKISMYPHDRPIVTANRAIAILRIRDFKRLNPYFAFAFLRSKYGFGQVIRNLRGGVQKRINLQDFFNILIPIPSNSFQNRMEKLIKEAYEKKKIADELYKQAERLLLEQFGISGLKYAKKKTHEVRFSEVFRHERFDAEHYKPEYEQVINILEKCGFELRKLKHAINISARLVDPAREPAKKFMYVELANVNPSTGEIKDYEEIVGYKAPSRARILLKKGDVLVSSLSGSLDNIGLVPDYLHSSIGSTGFFVINSELFYSEYLFLLFRSDLIKKQLEQKTAGTIMTAVSRRDFKNLLIPTVPKAKQLEISNLIQESFKLRKESNKLIQKAVNEVEQLIESAAQGK